MGACASRPPFVVVADADHRSVLRDETLLAPRGTHSYDGYVDPVDLATQMKSFRRQVQRKSLAPFWPPIVRDDDDSDDSDDEPSSPSRRDALGRHVRRDGWEPEARQNPNGTGMAKWRHPWETSKLWQLLQRPETYDEGGYWGRIFRARTGCPRKLFDQLVVEVKGYREVRTHQSGDGVKAPPTIPVELKLAAFLRFMRMSGLLQGHADYADIDVETLRRFGKAWTAAVVKWEYDKHVYPPAVGTDEFRLVMAVHARCGFPGCVGMTDGVHVSVDMVPWSLHNDHLGKEGSPTRGFNVTGDYRRIIHFVHRSHAGGDNDKTLSRYDEHMQRIKLKELYADVEFDLYSEHARGQDHGRCRFCDWCSPCCAAGGADAAAGCCFGMGTC